MGPKVNQSHEYYTTSLVNACKNGHEPLVKYLIEHGVDINEENEHIYRL